MIEIAVTCIRCGVEWTLSHHDYITGRWCICLACRGDPTIDTNAPTERPSGAANDSRPYVSHINEKDAAP